MNKTCKILKEFFDVQNEEVYAARGVNWLTCGTVLYMRLTIVDSELQAFPKYVENGQMNTSKNSNKEVLLKAFK